MRVLAEAACQRSYLSQVIHSHAHLTADQDYGIARHWKLKPHETDYFLRLIEVQRCGSPAYREHLEQKLRELKRRNSDLRRKAPDSDSVSAEIEGVYYSAWYWAAIHLIVSAPRYQTSSAIAARLQLPAELVDRCLRQLQEWGMVRNRGSRWEFAGGNVHLPKRSPLVLALHQNWRTRALLDVSLGGESSLHYSSVHALNPKAFAEIKARLERMVEETHDIAAPSPSEDLACVNFDLFRV